MKRLISLISLVLACSLAVQAQELKFVNADEYPIFGKADPNTMSRYERFPESMKDVRPAVLYLSRDCAGLYVRFRTDSKNIGARWTSLYKNLMPHMTPTGTRGLDLYQLREDGWKYIGTAQPDLGDATSERVMINNLKGEMHEYMLNLSLYDGITSLEIGIDPDAVIEQPQVDSPKAGNPIVMYGTSILQGGCANRPGMVHTSIISRALDKEVVNLGFSGNALLDLEVAHLMASVKDPALFVLDYAPNAWDYLIDSTGEEFFRIIRDAHPDVPVIFIEDVRFPTYGYNTFLTDEVDKKNISQRRLYERLRRSGEKKISYISSVGMAGFDHEAFVDNIHFTDLGMMRYVDFVMPYIKAALEGRDMGVSPVSGSVTCKGKPVAGVWVSDGFTFAQTGADGRFTIEMDECADFLFAVTPSGYEAPQGRYSPDFYISADAIREGAPADFTLVKAGKQKEYLFVDWADVQAYVPEDLEHVRKASADLRALAASSKMPVYGIIGGDLIGERNWEPLMYEPTSDAIAESGVQFRYLCGNHDLDLGIKADHEAKKSFRSLYGPTCYSFNIGEAHYIVMDNVFCEKDWGSVGKIGKVQLEWIRQDLSHCSAGQTVFVCSHIPTWSPEAREGLSEEKPSETTADRDELYALLAPFNAHILSNHQHYAENFILGNSLMEHVNPPLSGLFWQSLLSCDGLPYGYMVYHVKGSALDWRYKAVGSDDDAEFSVYKVGEDPIRKDCVTVNVWNYDPLWTVEWWENGEYRGAMEQFRGYDAAIDNDVKARRATEFRWDYIGAGATWHMFSARPSSPSSTITVKVTDRFGRCWTRKVQ